MDYVIELIARSTKAHMHAHLSEALIKYRTIL